VFGTTGSGERIALVGLVGLLVSVMFLAFLFTFDGKRDVAIVGEPNGKVYKDEAPSSSVYVREYGSARVPDQPRVRNDSQPKVVRENGLPEGGYSE